MHFFMHGCTWDGIPLVWLHTGVGVLFIFSTAFDAFFYAWVIWDGIHLWLHTELCLPCLSYSNVHSDIKAVPEGLTMINFMFGQIDLSIFHIIMSSVSVLVVHFYHLYCWCNYHSERKLWKSTIKIYCYHCERNHEETLTYFFINCN